MRQIERSFRIAVHVFNAALVLSAASASAAELKATDFALMDRLTWGITTSGAEHLRSVGTERWLDEQLHPKDQPLPPQIASQIEAMPDVHRLPFDVANAFDQQNRAANQLTDPEQKKAAQQAFQQAMNDAASGGRSLPLARSLLTRPAARTDDLVLAQPLQCPSVQSEHPPDDRRL